MPRRAADPRSRILERLELESLWRQAHSPCVLQQSCAVSGDQVRHGCALPDVAMKPEPTVHREDHPLST